MMMQENVKKYLEKLREIRGTQRKTRVIVAVCALLMAVGVIGALTLPGITQEGEPVCGLEEHMHSDTCYATATAGDGVSMEQSLVCTLTEHTHSDDCYQKEELHDRVELLTEFGEDASSEGGEVNERLKVQFIDKGQVVAGTGSALYVKVVSNYSGANSGANAVVSIDLGTMPEGITLAAFNDDGTKEVTIKDLSTGEETDQRVTLHFETDGNNMSRIWFEQPQGSTLEFDLQFNSAPGIMQTETTLTLKIEEDDISGIQYNEGGTDVLPEPFTLTWTAGNLWENLDKKVNGEDANTIYISSDDKFSGILTYTITANSSNNESTGEIWTDHLIVKDTLTLPENFSLPEGAEIRDGAIVTADGATILSFTNIQGGTVESLVINGKEISYELNIPNAYKDENGVPQQEQDHLELAMELNTELLVLPAGYASKDATVIAKDIIQNKVEVTPVPYKECTVTTLKDEVTTTPKLLKEQYSFWKAVNKTQAGPGEELRYVIHFLNNGSIPLSVKDSSGNYYAVTDTLKPFVYLTAEQEASLQEQLAQNGGNYDPETRTISWIPSVEPIPAKTQISFYFWVTVQDAKTMKEEMAKAKYVTNFDNSAYYRGTRSTAWVTYKAPYITLEKSADVEEVADNDDVTYTVTLKNVTAYTSEEQILTDTLPDSLELKSVTIGTTTVQSSEIEENTPVAYTYHEMPATETDDETESTTTDETAGCQEKHEVTFTKNGQELSWNVGCLAGNETVVLTYTCTAHTEGMENKTNGITNVAKTTDREAECKIGIKNPINITKTVDADTKLSYPDQTVFDYTITVTNDAEKPSDQTDLKLTDKLQSGLLPYGCTLYKSNGTTETEMEWTEYSAATSNELEGYTFRTVIDEKEATVTKDNNNNIILCWNIAGPLSTTEPYVISYQAQIHLTEDQLTDGESHDFTNEANIDGMYAEVTVKGGDKLADLTIQKCFPNKYNGRYDFCALEEDDWKNNIIFKLTGTDAAGNAVIFADTNESYKEISVKEFTLNSQNLYEYTITDLPVGNYTLEEIGYAPNGEKITQTYTLTVNATKAIQTNGSGTPKPTFEFQLLEDSTLKCENVYRKPNNVNIQKSVHEIAKVSEDGTWTSTPDKDMFLLDGEDTYVVYNVTVSSFGDDRILFYDMKDILPDGLEYVGLYDKADYTSVEDFVLSIKSQPASKLSATQKMVDPDSLEDDVYSRREVVITGDTVVGNEVRFRLWCCGWDRYKGSSFNEYGADYERTHPLYCGETFSFMILCKVKDDVQVDATLTNTIELVVASDVELDSTKEYQMINTPYDANQNNGDAKVTVENNNGYKTIASSVTIEPKETIVPGIEKNAVVYLEAETSKENLLEDETNISPSSAVKWEVKLYNDGTTGMKDYTVEDSVTADFHFMTQSEAAKHSLDKAFTYAIYNYKGEQIGETYDLSPSVWSTVTEGAKISNYTFEFAEDQYEVPAGGYGILTVYTYNTVDSKKIYKNTATILPKQEFTDYKVRHGELKKDSSGKYIGVTASDEVYALGEYASVSWKTITEKEDKTNTAKGNQSKNYISVGLESRYVTYTNNIKNVSGNDFHNFVVVDLMPIINDTGVVNRDDDRGSEFSVLYDGNMKIQVLDKDGKVVSEPTFTVEFSSKTGFTESDFAGETTTSWHSEWQSDDCSFRVILDKDFKLKSQQTMVISYDGKIDQAAKPGAIAWNSFGYQYYSSGHDTPMRAEPPKVGVMIPAEQIIQKQVVDSHGKEQSKDANIEFSFVLWKDDTKLSEFTICQGGYKKLSELVDENGDPIKLVNGAEYTVTENTDEESMPEGYEFVGSGLNHSELDDSNSYTFTYYDSKKIDILIRNKVDNYTMKLPETGGIGTAGFKVLGALLILLAAALCGYLLKGKKETKV